VVDHMHLVGGVHGCLLGHGGTIACTF
jgi:hypothetical protein